MIQKSTWRSLLWYMVYEWYTNGIDRGQVRLEDRIKQEAPLHNWTLEKRDGELEQKRMSSTAYCPLTLYKRQMLS